MYAPLPHNFIQDAPSNKLAGNLPQILVSWMCLKGPLMSSGLDSLTLCPVICFQTCKHFWISKFHKI